MSHLLHVTRWNFDSVKRGATPLILEFPVSPETAPFLVTSSTGLMWIEEPPGKGEKPGTEHLVRAAVREGTPGDIFAQVIEAVVVEGRKRKWGNIHPLTTEGLIAGIDHLAYYDLDEYEVLAPSSDVDPGRKILKALERPYRPCSWMPKGHLVVVPKDRSFLGVLGKLSAKNLAGVVHNAARGMAVMAPTTPKRRKRT